MKKDPSLKRQASAIFIGTLIGTFFRFLMPAVIVRLISQEDFGVFRQFQLLAGTFSGLLGMGLGSSLFYFFPTSDALGKKKIIQQTEFLLLINLSIFILVFIFFGDEILTYLNFKEFISVKPIVVLFVSFTLLSSMISVIFTLEKNITLNQVFPSIDKIVRFIVFLIVILIVPGFLGPIIALLIYAIMHFSYFIYHIFPYIKNIYKLNGKLLKQQLTYTLPFGFALILNLISNTYDKFFINTYITPSEFGIYSISFLSIPILGQFFKSIHNVVVPQISVHMKNGEVIKARDLWKKTVEKTSSVTIPIVFLFWLLANEIVTVLYTIEYIKAANYYRIFILMFLVSMFSHEIILRAANKTRYILYSNIIATILTIIIGFIIIPKYGTTGAVLTALFAAVTPMLISLHFERRIMKLSLKNWVNWNKIFINFILCFLVFLPIFFFKDYIDNLYVRSIIVGLIFCTSIVFLQIRFKLFIFNAELLHLSKKIKSWF